MRTIHTPNTIEANFVIVCDFCAVVTAVAAVAAAYSLISIRNLLLLL